MTITYSTDADLLIGDITYDTGTTDRFRVIAKNEIDSKLGWLYVLPLTGITSHITLILQNIESHIATGRLILDRAAGGEDSALQAYGASLLKEGQDDLMMIMSGMLVLTGAQRIASEAAEGNAPSIIEGDMTSGVDAYYGWVSQPAWANRGIYGPYGGYYGRYWP